jgi:hypothetical protein
MRYGAAEMKVLCSAVRSATLCTRRDGIHAIVIYRRGMDRSVSKSPWYRFYEDYLVIVCVRREILP